EPQQLSAAYEGLAASITMPEAAAALYLRAAAMAASQGDIDSANARVTAARAAAPDDASALLVVAETSALPAVESAQLADDTSRRDAVDALLARAEVLEMRAALADDPTARASWELDRAEALELGGRLREAGTVVAAVLAVSPGDLRALEAMRRLARRANDMDAWAHASYQLARVLGDPAAKLELLRDAATVLDRSDGDPSRVPEVLAIYRRILQVDPGAPEHDRLLELYRQRADVRGLVTALTERLAWLESDEEDLGRQKQMVPLLLERATVLLGLGDQHSAMADLDALLDRAASHVEALRFRADLAFNTGDLQLAVDLWNRTLAVETRPERRRDIELRLAQVYEENENLGAAIENLGRVVETNPDDVQLRERLLGLCLRGGEWDRAARELRGLAQLRPTPAEKARDELRLGLMLRDRLDDRAGARLALDRARALDPLNLDVVRELAELLEPAARAQVLAATASTFRASIAQNPRGPILFDRLAQVTGWQSDVDARWLALVGLEALGTPSVDQRQVLEQGRGKLGLAQKLKLDEATRAAIRGNAFGALCDLWRAIAPAVQIATGVDAAKLGFVRGDKLPLKKLAEKYDPLAGALYCFGLEDVEIYVGAQRAGVARALAGETTILCAGADVAAAHMPHQRWLLGRMVAMAAEGFTGLLDLRDAEVGWTVAAALRGCDAQVPAALAAEVAGDEQAIAERAKIIKSKISRKAKAAVVQLAAQRPHELVDVAGFRRAALAVGHRAGLLWAGDLAVALAQLDVGRGGKSLTDSPPALELTGWSVSEEHQRLREKLGIALKVAR
ncbi:MAG: hypothetical protein KIT31_43010, partial [Deltaproteobacteria bacterium]|nr:hypothetical protein [Deltaproteobacteria bacterium]